MILLEALNNCVRVSSGFSHKNPIYIAKIDREKDEIFISCIKKKLDRILNMEIEDAIKDNFDQVMMGIIFSACLVNDPYMTDDMTYEDWEYQRQDMECYEILLNGKIYKYTLLAYLGRNIR